MEQETSADAVQLRDNIASGGSEKASDNPILEVEELCEKVSGM